MTIQQRIENENIRKTTPFVITPTQAGYKVNGELIPAKEFEQQYPLSFKRNDTKGDNSDRTNLWMHDKKSY